MRRQTILEDDDRDREASWNDIEAGLGALADQPHEWDSDPARWVHDQRFADASRVR